MGLVPTCHVSWFVGNESSVAILYKMGIAPTCHVSWFVGNDSSVAILYKMGLVPTSVLSWFVTGFYLSLTDCSGER